MPNRFSKIAEESAEKTKAQLDEQLSSLTRLTDDELFHMLPTKADKEHFAELMAIVTSSTSRNKKVAALRKNMGRFGNVLVRVLKTLA